jgi:hypothetical protein
MLRLTPFALYDLLTWPRDQGSETFRLSRALQNFLCRIQLCFEQTARALLCRRLEQLRGMRKTSLSRLFILRLQVCKGGTVVASALSLVTR